MIKNINQKKHLSSQYRESLGISRHPEITRLLNATLSEPLLDCICYYALTRFSCTYFYIIILTLPIFTFTCPRLSLFYFIPCVVLLYILVHRCLYSILCLASRTMFLFNVGRPKYFESMWFCC